MRACPVCLEPKPDCICDLDDGDDETAEAVAQAWRSGADESSDEEDVP